MGFSLFFWWTLGLFSFNPTDEGFVLAQSWRVLNGQIPHVDFASPRPAGSALMHIVDVLSPVGTFAISRFIVAVQLATIAWISTRLLSARWPLTKASQVAVFLMVFMLNVGIWPLMAWQTIDGIFLTMVASWLIYLGPKKSWIFATAWIIAGAAILMKQGFIVAPVIISLLIIQTRRWKAFRWIWAAALPALAYVYWTREAFGGLLPQLNSGSVSQYLYPLYAAKFQLTQWNTLGALIVVIGAFTYLFIFKPNRPIIRIAVGLLAMLPTILLAIGFNFQLTGETSYHAFLAFAIAGIYTALNKGEWLLYLAIAILAYGITMSWGVPNPNLLTGTLIAGVFLAALKPSAEKLAGNHLVAVMLLPLLVLTGVGFVDSRLNHAYREKVGSIAVEQTTLPGFVLLRMNPQTVAYLESANSCITEFPADRTAILPDGPALYPGLRILSPFQTDWLLPLEEVSDWDGWTNQSISKINQAKTTSLVLFQSYILNDLGYMPISKITETNRPTAYAEDDLSILERIQGTAVKCDSFTGVLTSVK